MLVSVSVVVGNPNASSRTREAGERVAANLACDELMSRNSARGSNSDAGTAT